MRAAMPADIRDVRLNDCFWTPRQEINRRVTLGIEYQQCKETGRIDAFRLDWKPGKPNQPHMFWDSDVAKWVEACGYSLAAHPDAALRKQVGEVIDLIVSAQQPDGYLNVYFTVCEPDKRWANLRDWHELYCAGHLIEAGVAMFEGIGDRRLLEAAQRYADLIGEVFGRGPNQKRGYCGHEEIELALVRLYRATGQRRYLDLAAYFIDERGRQPHYFDSEARQRGEDPAEWWTGYFYNQSHAPVREQTKVVGHAVRAMYLYSAMADVAAETGDKSLQAACRRLWRDLVRGKLYITGGVGASGNGERFSYDYDLPNETAYAETCAAIGLVFFADRMARLERDAVYADVMERALYNGVLSGVSLDGTRFFYANPLAAYPPALADGRQHGPMAVERQPWFGCACCPPNIARLLASLGRYIYACDAKTIYVQLYAANEATLHVADGEVRLVQETDYPWSGTVRLTVADTHGTPWALALRLPGWCRKPSLTLNGKRVALENVRRKGYAVLSRAWREGDALELSLPMPIERIAAHPRLRHNCGRIALQRGPLVYCIEEIDNGPHLNDLVLPRSAKLRAAHEPKLLGGVVAITGKAQRRDLAAWGGELYRADAVKSRTVPFMAVPYYAWSNRKPGEMLVWIREA